MDADACRGHRVQLAQFRRGGMGADAHRHQIRLGSGRDGVRRRKRLAQSQRASGVRVLKEGGELGEELVADGGELILAPGGLTNQLVAVADEPAQQGGCFHWWDSAADQLRFVGDLGAELELGVKAVGKAKRVTLIGLE